MMHWKTTLIITLAGVVVYFTSALWAKNSYVDLTPKGDDVTQMLGPFEKSASGFFYSIVWLKKKDATIVIYEDGVSIGNANAVYKDLRLVWMYHGRQWKDVEFQTSDNSNPNENGRRYWAAPTMR